MFDHREFKLASRKENHNLYILAVIQCTVTVGLLSKSTWKNHTTEALHQTHCQAIGATLAWFALTAQGVCHPLRRLTQQACENSDFLKKLSKVG
jgi:transposase